MMARRRCRSHEANISEALVYRHFTSKLALYRAVLRQVFIEQDQNWEEIGVRDVGAAGIVKALNAFFRACVLETDKLESLDRHRMTLGSLAGDGSYAALIYRRSLRRNQKTVQTAIAQARDAGDIIGEPLDVNTTSMFAEHVGTMISAISTPITRTRNGYPLWSKPTLRRRSTLYRDMGEPVELVPELA